MPGIQRLGRGSGVGGLPRGRSPSQVLWSLNLRARASALVVPGRVSGSWFLSSRNFLLAQAAALKTAKHYTNDRMLLLLLNNKLLLCACSALSYSFSFAFIFLFSPPTLQGGRNYHLYFTNIQTGPET